MKIKEDVLKQLLAKISQLESRIISLEGSVSSLERFNNRDRVDPSYWQDNPVTAFTECGSTSTYPTLHDCKLKFEGKEFDPSFKFPPTQRVV